MRADLRPRVLSLVVAVLGMLQGHAALADGARFYDRASEGWFWYRDPALAPKPPKPKPPEKPSEPPPAPRKEEPPTQQVIQPAGPAPLSAEWLKVNIPKYLDKAIDEPTSDNVRAYYYLQRLAMDKSSRFARVAQEVVMGDPRLDETSRQSITNYVANEVPKVAAAATDEVLRGISQSAGLFFFFRSDCRFCHVMAPVLQQFASTYGFSVLPVSLDGGPLPDGIFPNYQTDNGVAATLKVDVTPAVFLAIPPNTFVGVSQGALSMNELSDRIVMAAHKAGLVDDATFSRTRGVNEEHDLTRVPFDPSIDDADLLIQSLQR